MVKDVLTSNSRRSDQARAIATMVKQSLIRFNKKILIQELIERETLSHIHKGLFLSKFYLSFIQGL